MFPVNIAKFLRTPILKNVYKRLFVADSIAVTVQIVLPKFFYECILLDLIKLIDCWIF